MGSESGGFYHVYNYNIRKVLVDRLVELINGIDKNYCRILIVGIGNNHNTDDFLGPLVGQILINSRCKSYQVIGTLSHPIKGDFLPKIIPDEIRSQSLIIAIDACVRFDNNDDVGKIAVRQGPIHPGSGYGKGKPPIGDISILGIVVRTEQPCPEYLSESAPGLIYDMADKIAQSIKMALKQTNLINRFDSKARIEIFNT